MLKIYLSGRRKFQGLAKYRLSFMKIGMDLFSVQANKQTAVSSGGSECTLYTNYGSVFNYFYGDNSIY